MSLKETFWFALNALRANKLRSALTMTGITIGVFSVISVMTATGAMQSTIESGLNIFGSNIFQFAKYGIVNGGGAKDVAKYQNRRNITYAEANAYAQKMRATGTKVCLKVFDDKQYISFGNRKSNSNLTLVGTDPWFMMANGYQTEYGRFLTEEDVTYERRVIVLGSTIARRLFPNQNPLGKTVKVANKPFDVVGVFAEKGTALGGSRDDIVTVPISRYFEEFGSLKRTVNIANQPPNQAALEHMKDVGIGYLRAARELKEDQENDFEVYSNDSLIGAFASIAGVVRVGALVISSIALMAAGVGIMNIMLVSVTERTKEIGIRKSVGAKRSYILRQFLIESVLLSEIGGLIGIILGVIIGNVLASLLNADVMFPWGWALTGVVVCSLVGIGFGMYPAWRAASLDPIEALRYE